MEYKNILIIKMSSLGDILHTLPFAAALRKLYPHAKLTWLVHPQFAGFVPDPPVIDEVLYFDKVKFNKMGLKDKLGYFREMRNLLHSKHFDLVIDMQGLFKSAVLAAISGCPNRIGYAEMREGSGLVSKAISGPHRNDHVIERYLDVARHLGAKVESLDDVEFPMPNLTWEKLQVVAKLKDGGAHLRDTKNDKWARLNKGEKQSGLDEAMDMIVPYVVIVPGARWVTKEWPIEHYITLIKKIIDTGVDVVLAGGPDDAVKGKKIAEGVGPSFGLEQGRVIDLTGKTSLRELAALIDGCSVYISADTGPLHFAAALKKPLIAMYGPTKADRTGPYGSKNSTVLLSPAKCAGCLKKQCNNWHCMHDITPERVFEIYQKKVAEAK